MGCPEEDKEEDDVMELEKTIEKIREGARVRGARVRDRVTF